MTRSHKRISIAELKRCAAAGMSRRKAAELLGCSPAGIRYVIDKYDIEWANGMPGRPRNEEPEPAPEPAPEATPLERMKALAAQENAALRRVLEAPA